MAVLFICLVSKEKSNSGGKIRKKDRRKSKEGLGRSKRRKRLVLYDCSLLANFKFFFHYLTKEIH